MIIPVRCFTCGKVLADKWAYYERRCRELGDDVGSEPAERLGSRPGARKTPPPQSGGAPQMQTPPQPLPKTARGRVLDELGLTSGCCRTIMLTHVDMSGII